MGDLTQEEAKLFMELNQLTVEQLRERVAKGNDRLMDHYTEIMKERDNDTWEGLLANLDIAVARLGLICDFLVFKGYKECLYMENGKKVRSCLNQRQDNIVCWCCPSTIKWWEEELFGAGAAPVEYHSRHGKALMDFIKRGGKL